MKVANSQSVKICQLGLIKVLWHKRPNRVFCAEMPKGTREFHFSFEERHLTHFGVMWFIQRFCNKIEEALAS